MSYSPLLVRPRAARGRSMTRKPKRGKTVSVTISPPRHPQPRKTTGGRRGRPRKRTMQKRNFKTVPGVGGQVSNFRLGRPMPSYVKPLLKLTNFKTHRALISQRLDCVQGQQASMNFAYLQNGGYAQITNPAYDIAYLLNQASLNGIGGGNISDNSPSTTTKIYIKKVFAKFMMTNMDIGNAQVHIFDIICKRDYPQGATIAFGNGISDVTTGAQDQRALGLMPWSSPEFNTHFRVLQKSSVILAQGQSHMHYVNYSPNKIFTAERLVSSDNSLAGATLFTMILIHGLPVNDRDTKTNVSTGSVSLDIVQTREVHWSWMEHNRSSWSTTGALPVLTNEYEINIGSGLPTLDTEA